MQNNQRIDDCNHAVLAFLAPRQALKFDTDSIRDGVNRKGGDYTDAEITDALVFLKGLNYVTDDVDPLGTTKYYQATSTGVLFQRRGH